MPVQSQPVDNQGFPWRLFTSPVSYSGAQLAIGRNHASWFLVRAYPENLTLKREVFCLNFLVPGDPSTVSSVNTDSCCEQRPRFTVGGTQGQDVLSILLELRDQVGRPSIKVIRRYDANPMSLQAIVEINIPEDELVRACARCGRWEAMGRPRFQRCARCKCRYYCSRQCQKEDWTPEHHKSECALLSEGKEYEVECHRKLHDNGWWFNHGSLGPESILLPPDVDALPADKQDDWKVYGRRTPPRDVRQHPTYDVNSAVGSNAHGSLVDGTATAADDATELPPSERCVLPFTKNDIPKLPPLPTPPGFVPTGDPLVDEALLWDHLKRGKSPRELLTELVELNKILQARCEVLLTRREMALHLAVELALAEDQGDEEYEDSDESGDGYGTDWESLATVSQSSDSETSFSSDDDDERESGTNREADVMAVVMYGRSIRDADIL